MFKIFGLFLTLALSLIIVSCGTGEADPKVTTTTIQTQKYVTMPENTQISVTLVDSIDTDFQLPGDIFRARLNQPVVVDGHTLFADGADARGILNRVVESGRLETPAELDFTLTAIQDRNGNWADVSTSTIKDKQGSHTNREVAMIGGGAIVGGIIGKIIDRDGSTEIGVGAGAVAGTILASRTGKKDIFYGVGSEIVFFSNQSMQIALK